MGCSRSQIDSSEPFAVLRRIRSFFSSPPSREAPSLRARRQPAIPRSRRRRRVQASLITYLEMPQSTGDRLHAERKKVNSPTTVTALSLSAADPLHSERQKVLSDAVKCWISDHVPDGRTSASATNEWQRECAMLNTLYESDEIDEVSLITILRLAEFQAPALDMRFEQTPSPALSMKSDDG